MRNTAASQKHQLLDFISKGFGYDYHNNQFEPQSSQKPGQWLQSMHTITNSSGTSSCTSVSVVKWYCVTMVTECDLGGHTNDVAA